MTSLTPEEHRQLGKLMGDVDYRVEAQLEKEAASTITRLIAFLIRAYEAYDIWKCRSFHGIPWRPFRGVYTCPDCLRRYASPWR